MYNSSLADRARYFKEEEKGVRTMCKIADELFNQGIEQGRRNQLVLSIQNILSDGITDIDKIAKYAGASTEEAKEILAELNVSL